MRIGIFICHCGHNIKAKVDVEHLSSYFRGFPHVFCSQDYPFLCSEPGQALIKKAIKENFLDRVVIAACSPSLHSELFMDLMIDANLNPYMLKRVSIREHCSFVGEDPTYNTEKAKSLIRAGIYSIWHNLPLEKKRFEVKRSCLIIGGGISGLSAAALMSNLKMKVYLVEKEKELGGHVRYLRNVWPTNKSGSEIVGSLIAMLEGGFVEIFTQAQIESAEGNFGDYKVKVQAKEEKIELNVGGIIVAIGFAPFDMRLKKEIPYGIEKKVITTFDFETNFYGLKLPQFPKIAIVNCVGSRDEKIRRPYCSRICCLNSLKTANEIKTRYPQSYVECFYMDLRADKKGAEEFYEACQRKGVMFTRSNVAEITHDGDCVILRGEDTLTGEVFEKKFDLVILSTGIMPPPDGERIAQILKIPLDKDGFFLEAHPKLRPFETQKKGIFIAGCCSGPKDVEECIAFGRAAALKLFSMLNTGYSELEPYVAEVEKERCSGCRICEEVCVPKAISYEQQMRVVKVDLAQCMGCGLCAATCPSSAISLLGFTDRKIIDETYGLIEKG